MVPDGNKINSVEGIQMATPNLKDFMKNNNLKDATMNEGELK